MTDLSRRVRVRATLERSSVFHGASGAYDGPQTLLFRDVVDAETELLIRDHAWLQAGAWWTTGGLNLTKVTVEFDVTIGPVVKGHMGEFTERTLEFPSRRIELGFYDPDNLSFPVDEAGWPIRNT